MADREKVVKALKECIFLHEHPDDDAGCLECPYRPDEKGTCPTMIPFLKDVLELLKGQEPVRPIYQGDDSYACDNCGEIVGWEEMACCGIDQVKFKYCPGCGRKVEWE